MTWTIFEQALGHTLWYFTLSVWIVGALAVCWIGNEEMKDVAYSAPNMPEGEE